MSASEATLLVGIVAACVLAGFLAGIMLSIKCGFHILKRLGWKLFVIHDDPANRASDDDEPNDEQTGTTGNENAAPSDGVSSGGSIMTGRCRGCGLPHIGLIPAVVEVTGPQSYNIPSGSPAVCPRCWCKMNPTAATNIVSQFEAAANDAGHAARAAGGGGPPTENLMGRPMVSNDRVPASVPTFGPPMVDDEAAPVIPAIDLNMKEPPEGVRSVPAHKGYPEPAADNDKGLSDDQLEALTNPSGEAPKEPPVACVKCGKGTGPFRPQLDGGKPTGRFWCQGCIDALGGPPKAVKKKRKE